MCALTSILSPLLYESTSLVRRRPTKMRKSPKEQLIERDKNCHAETYHRRLPSTTAMLSIFLRMEEGWVRSVRTAPHGGLGVVQQYSNKPEADSGLKSDPPLLARMSSYQSSRFRRLHIVWRKDTAMSNAPNRKKVGRRRSEIPSPKEPCIMEYRRRGRATVTSNQSTIDPRFNEQPSSEFVIPRLYELMSPWTSFPTSCT